MNCPICSGCASYKFSSHLHKRVYQCEDIRCRHLFTEDFSVQSGLCDRGEDLTHENLRAQRDERVSLYGDRNRAMFKVIFTKLNLKKDAKVLDFGSGDGNLMLSLREVYPEVNVTCIEPHKVFSKLLTDVADSVVDDISDLKEKYDLIVLNEVIEHINYPGETLKHLALHLEQQRSAIYIATPLGENHLGSNQTEAYDTDSHLHFFTRKSLNLCLRKAGLTSLDFDDLNYPIYTAMLDKSTKGKMKFWLRNLLFNKVLNISIKRCVLPRGHISGLSYLEP